MATTRKMLVLTDATGRIVAAAHPGAASSSGMGVGITQLPGQTIHEVDVPEAVTRLTGRDFHQMVSGARFVPGTPTLVFPEIRVHRHEDE